MWKQNEQPYGNAFSYFSINLSFLLCCICFVRKCFHPLHWLQALKNCKVFSSWTAATDRKWVSSGCIHAVSWLAAGKIWGHYSSGCSVYFPELFLSWVHKFCFRFKNTEKYVSCCMAGWKYVWAYAFFTILCLGFTEISAVWEKYICSV